MSETDIVERDNVWTLDRAHSWDGAAIVVAKTKDGVSVSVTQEQAVDSYNESFTCVMQLSAVEAETLGLFLIRTALPKAPTQ